MDTESVTTERYLSRFRFPARRLLPAIILLLHLFAGGMILCLFAFYNRYPLVYSDTGTYIYSGFANFFPIDRPVFYGLFIRHISLKASLFLVIFMQGMIISYMMHCFFRYVCRLQKPLRVLLPACLVLSGTTGLSVIVSELIPDVFTGVVFIGMLVLLYGENIRKTDKLFLTLITCLALIVHLSHLVIFMIFILLVLVIYAASKYYRTSFFYPKGVFWVAGIYLVSILIYPATHYAYDKKFYNPEASAVFKINKLNELGIMQDFLRNNCNQKHYSLCDYLDKPEFNYGFLWDPNSPANLNGGWAAHVEEYERIIDEVMAIPKYQRIYRTKAVEGTFVQLFSFDVSDIFKSDAEGAPLHIISSKFPQDLHWYFGTRQNKGTLDFGTLNMIQYILMAIAALIILVIWNWKLLKETEVRRISSGILLLLFFFFINAFVCSTLSIIASRFQMRIIWLLPVFAFWMLLHVDVEKLKSAFYRQSES